MVTSGVVNLYGISLSKIIGRAISKINYTTLNSVVLLFIATASLYFDGLLGLAVLLTAATIGVSATILRIKRTTCMGVLMLKIMIN